MKKIILSLFFFASLFAPSLQAQLGTLGVGGGGSAGPSYGIVHTASCVGGNPGSGCTTSSITVAAGHALAAFAWGCTGSFCNAALTLTALTVSDTSGSNSWQMPVAGFGTQTGGSFQQASQVAYACNAAAGSYTFSVAATGANSDFVTLLVAEVSGVSTSSGTGCVDSAVTATGSNPSSANPSITSGTVGQASEFIYAGIGFVGGVTANQTDILNLSTSYGNADEQYTVGPSSGTQVMSWTATANEWAGGILGFKHP